MTSVVVILWREQTMLLVVDVAAVSVILAPSVCLRTAPEPCIETSIFVVGSGVIPESLPAVTAHKAIETLRCELGC